MKNLKASQEACRKCGSEKLKYWKKIHQGKLYKQFHYGVRCQSCNTRYKVSRSKYIYEQVKDINWLYSKNAKRLMKKEQMGREA